MGKNSRRHHADKQRRAAERRRRQGSQESWRPTTGQRQSCSNNSSVRPRRCARLRRTTRSV